MRDRRFDKNCHEIFIAPVYENEVILVTGCEELDGYQCVSLFYHLNLCGISLIYVYSRLSFLYLTICLDAEINLSSHLYLMLSQSNLNSKSAPARSLPIGNDRLKRTVPPKTAPARTFN